MGHFKATGPISLQGQVPVVPDAGTLEVVLKVLSFPDATERKLSQNAYVSSSTHQQFGGGAYVELAKGSDCVLAVRPADDVPGGCIIISDTQQYNLRVVHGESYGFRSFHPPSDAPFGLLALEADVKLMASRQAAGSPVTVDAEQLAGQLARASFQQVLAVNQLVVLQHADVDLVLRVTCTDSLSPQEQQEALGYHCYRGLLAPGTAVYLTADVAKPAGGGVQGAAALLGTLTLQEQQHTSSSSSQQQHSHSNGCHSSSSTLDQQQQEAQGPGLILVNARGRSQQPPPTNIVNITTQDGEWFPVKKALLRPCIALTKVVRSTDEEAPSITVDVDTLTFDRVLIYVEALALGRPVPSYAVHLLPDLLKAAQALGLRSLEERCREQLGSRAAAVRVYRLEEVVARNAEGNCWLVLDGMVLDVTRWLPEHPGGSRIIPQQSLNLDCARFFELYHASRESFLYLQDFYLGELHPGDRADLAMGGREPPSQDFLAQLRQYTSFRLPVAGGFKSHLEGRARAAAVAGA